MANCSMQLSVSSICSFTTDQVLRNQQNLAGRKLAILVLPFASWPKLKPNTGKIALRIEKLRAGEYARLQFE
jgi:hypothetical protein